MQQITVLLFTHVDNLEQVSPPLIITRVFDNEPVKTIPAVIHRILWWKLPRYPTTMTDIIAEMPWTIINTFMSFSERLKRTVNDIWTIGSNPIIITKIKEETKDIRNLFEYNYVVSTCVSRG